MLHQRWGGVLAGALFSYLFGRRPLEWRWSSGLSIASQWRHAHMWPGQAWRHYKGEALHVRVNCISHVKSAHKLGKWVRILGNVVLPILPSMVSYPHIQGDSRWVCKEWCEAFVTDACGVPYSQTTKNMISSEWNPVACNSGGNYEYLFVIIEVVKNGSMSSCERFGTICCSD